MTTQHPATRSRDMDRRCNGWSAELLKHLGIVANLGVIGIAALLLAGCSIHKQENQEPDIKPYDQIDVNAWRSELVKAGARNDPDMQSLYKAAKKDCDATVDSLAFQFAFKNVHPDWARIGMTYVCPSRLPKVGEALKKVQNLQDNFDQICRTPRDQRSPGDERFVVGEGSTCP
jgi:hypothetical protein